MAGLATGVGAQGAFYLTMQATTIQRNVPETERSRVFAWSQLGNLVLLPASLAAAGPVAATLGPRTVLVIGLVWLVTSTSLVMPTHAIRNMSAHSPFQSQLVDLDRQVAER